MELASNRKFWDEKARENPLWYVSSFVAYDRPDTEEFWLSGVRIWEDLKSATGYRPQESDVAVEIGCGVGRLTRAISRETSRVHAQDISPEMIAIARSHPLPNVTFYESDGASLVGIPDGCAHIVLAYNVFQHLPSLEVLNAYVREMTRVTRPGGLVVFTLSVRSWSTRLLSLMRVRRFVRESLSGGGPSGLYKKEWVGIRPTVGQVKSLSDVPLQCTTLHENKWLFWGRVS